MNENKNVGDNLKLIQREKISEGFAPLKKKKPQRDRICTEIQKKTHQGIVSLRDKRAQSKKSPSNGAQRENRTEQTQLRERLFRDDFYITEKSCFQHSKFGQ